jgi:hypothetical protein
MADEKATTNGRETRQRWINWNGAGSEANFIGSRGQSE